MIHRRRLRRVLLDVWEVAAFIALCAGVMFFFAVIGQ